MKRFHWPLQRLLEVAELRLQALRAELLDLSRQMAGARRDMVVRQAALRRAVSEFARRSLPDRLAAHAVFAQCAAIQERRLGRLREQLKALQDRHGQKMRELARATSSQQTLQRLRQEALDRHRGKVDLLEQKQLDESFQAAFARGVIGRRNEQHGRRSQA